MASHIFGYTGPIGPWVVTRDEIPDPHDLTVRCLHQGTVVTEDSTANLRHSVSSVLSFISQWLTLEPGDIVAMGTALAPATGGIAVQNVDPTDGPRWPDRGRHLRHRSPPQSGGVPVRDNP